MSFETAKDVIDRIFSSKPENCGIIKIGFIGGEPLLEFELIQKIYYYTVEKYSGAGNNFIFFATTNGTVLNDAMKSWFTDHKNDFRLGLSLDGQKESHDYNRCNSFDAIDIDFFRNTWPAQGVKMTLSDYSIRYLARDIKYLHSLGFIIHGVNLYEGRFDWDNDDLVRLLIPQLEELAAFYVENDSIKPNQMFDRHLHYCEAKNRSRQKWCGAGSNANFFDFDGKIYPCSFLTPMTFSQNELDRILKTDFSDDDIFIDDECFYNCYIYPVCPTCAGANYMLNKTFKKRDRSKCRIQKLISLFVADMQAKKIHKNPKLYDDTTLYYTIQAIQNIRSLYLNEFMPFL